MPEWERQLKESLVGLELAPVVQEEVIAELAGHLEDAYEGFLGQGIGAGEAANRAWSEFSMDRKLARRIQRAKQGEEDMNNRTRQFWLPALVTSLTGTGLLAFMVDALRLTPSVVPIFSESSMTIYLPWLLSLPVLGFFGAAMSRREGGTIRTRIVAGVFLSLIYFTVPFMFWPIALVVDHRVPTIGVLGLAWFLLNWAILPCLALLVGALPATFIGREQHPRTVS